MAVAIAASYCNVVRITIGSSQVEESSDKERRIYFSFWNPLFVSEFSLLNLSSATSK